MGVDRSRLPPLGAEPAFTFPETVKRTLPSGLRIWTVQHGELPVVTMLVLLPVGSAADPPGRPGLAALTGDLLDEGTGARSGLELHDALARIGAQFDTEVGFDATALSLTTLARFADRGLALLADVVRRPRFEPADVARVRDLRLSRILQLRDVPAAVAERAFTDALYRDHPYGHVPIGSEASLRAIGPDDVAAFHAGAYGPAGATIVLAGDASHETLFDLAAQAFGDWSGPAGGAGPWAAPDTGLSPRPPAPDRRLLLVARPNAAQSELRIGQVAAPRRTPDYHALLVLNMILGGQFVSRVNLNLRERKGYTYGARTAFEFRRGRGPFVLQTSVQTDATADAVREALAEIAAIRDDRPASDAEVELARAALTRGYPRGFESAEQVARAVSQLAIYDLPDDYFTAFVPLVRAVEAPDVTGVARAHLTPEQLSIVVVGDHARVADRLAALGLGPPIDLPAI